MGSGSKLFSAEEIGLFVVSYGAAEELRPSNQAELVRAIESVPAPRPVGIVFVVGAGVRTVEMDVPTFWLTQTGRRELRMRAIAIVTSSRAVAVAARGFALANRVRGLDLAVESFATEADATGWVRRKLTLREG